MMYWLTGFIGLTTVVSPFLFSFSNHPGALWSALIIGTILLLAAVIEGISHDTQTWEYWISGGLGVLALFSPFVLGFYSNYGALWTMMVAGIVTLIAVTARLTESDKGKFRY